MAEMRARVASCGVDLDRTTVRFGRACADGGTDSSKVQVSVNEAVSDAVRMKLLDGLRPASSVRATRLTYLSLVLRRAGTVRTGWIVKPGSDIPELTTMFVK